MAQVDTEFKQDQQNEDIPHNRYNPLRGEWTLVCPHRVQRPWAGQMEPVQDDNSESDPNNYLSPGATRSSGQVNPHYASTFTFKNDFPALLEGPKGSVTDLDELPGGKPGLFVSKPARGTCKVICYHPKSDVHIGTMKADDIKNVIDEWKKETYELGKDYVWVQILENRGQMMGCSNPHPHCQIWASDFIPDEPRIKDKHLKNYFEHHKRPLLLDYVEQEILKSERVVYENETWVVVVPYWAYWPFETMILPKKELHRFTDLSDEDRDHLADALQCLVAKYDNLFKCSFPYSMGFHGAPTGKYLAVAQPHWTFHAMFYPPLLRSATIKKFMAGYELLAQAQRDLTPEIAAAMLREQDTVHYKMKLKK